MRARRLCVIDEGLRVATSVLLPVFLFLTTPSFAGQSTAADLTTGESIYQAGCAGCHGPHGAGAPDTQVGFDKPETFPDFTRCDQTTPELDVDWKATILEGGHGRGFSPIMPSFAEELTSAQIDAVVRYLRGFCRERGWPRGELNLPRALTTEKAFPEDETVLTMAVTTHRNPDMSNELVYEHRIGVRNQLEVSVPFAFVHDETGTIARGVGDVGVGVKRVLFANSSAIFAAQGELIMPTGNKDKGLGAGVTVIEAFGSYGQLLPSNAFLQAQLGT